MQIKTTMRHHHLTLVRMVIIRRQEKTNVGEDVEKMEPSCTVGGIVSWNNHYGKKYGDSSKN